MTKEVLAFSAIFLVAMIFVNFGYSQEMGLATFQETAQLIVDKSISQNVTASIALQSTSIQEIRIPAEFEQKIHENNSVTAIVLTNNNQCILGVSGQSCIIINVDRDPQDKNFANIQNRTKNLADLFIGDLNKIFDTKAKYHSTFIHGSDEISSAYETSGAISGRGKISAVYTMPMEQTDSMYEKISVMLLPKIIRDSGGFYDVAKNLSKEEKAKMTFSILPSESKTLMQLKLSVDYPETAQTVTDVSPLEFFKADRLERSAYFSEAFYPLNSLLHFSIISPEPTRISDVRGNIIPTQVIDGEVMPTEINKEGWVFESTEGKTIQGNFIFGERTSINKDELIFSLGGDSLKYMIPVDSSPFDESTIIVLIISVVAIAAALFYLKGYKK